MEITIKDYKELTKFNALFITSLLTANILGTKIISIFGLQMPSATIAYAITYLMTDVVGELYGKKEANYLVKLGFIYLSISMIFIRIAIFLPSVNNATAFNYVFNSTTRIILGSLAGYLVSQYIDVYIFHKIKSIYEKYKFIRNNASTIISQFIDTLIFTFIGFYGIMPTITNIIWGIFIAKVIIALCDTPFFYLLTRQAKKKMYSIIIMQIKYKHLY
ncbi:queuosine precursor transporter [Treponema pedis]|uniref:queuosine precursor transporter n=1 Tax=Treponema pedis TaxID=409322 RepID=UPI0004097045|nr:queuosine precursor transporter [Treponema pedis]